MGFESYDKYRGFLHPRSSRKRKRSIDEEFVPRPMPGNRSLLLELPPEMRDLVYEKCLEEDEYGEEIDVYLPRTRNDIKDLIVHSPIARLNRKTRLEVIQLAALRAPLLKVPVLNFNFANFITFLNKMSDAQITKLNAKPNTLVPSRRMIFQLEFKEPGFWSGGADLRRWLNRFEHTEKKGTKIQFEYDGEKVGYPIKDVALLGDWGGSWEKVMKEDFGGDRVKEEKKKIREALWHLFD